jgi:regulatory protein
LNFKTDNERSVFYKRCPNKIEHYCYQERCHTEVEQKLRTMKMDSEEIDELLASNRFYFVTDNSTACGLPEGKHASETMWG